MLRHTRIPFVLAVALVTAQGASAADKAPPAVASSKPPVTADRAAVPAADAASRPEARAAYDRNGRRAPFVSLLSRGGTRLPSGGRPVGVTGLLISELSVRGVMRTDGKLLAIVQAPDNKTYSVHPGDALFDGTVKVVASDAVIFLQRVDDPLSPVKQREIRKTLRTSEENR